MVLIFWRHRLRQVLKKVYIFILTCERELETLPVTQPTLNMSLANFGAVFA